VTVTLDAAITVATSDLRNALRAVLPHAEPNKTGDNDAEHRLRLVFDKAHVNVMAANGATAALAIVSIEDDDRQERFAADDGPIVIDLTPRQGRHVLWAFKAKPADPEELERLRFNIGRAELTLTDDGGLFSGESIAFPATDPSDSFPDVAGILARAIAGVGASPVGKTLVQDGATLALFKDASRVYGQPLVISATGTPESRGWCVECGESFVGAVSSKHNDDDSLRKREAWHRGWLERLPTAKLAAV
jgi:hypothetical protein